MGVAELLTVLGLGGAGVTALWRIAFVTGRFEAKTTLILDGLQKWLQDHENRLRDLERS